MLKVDRYIGRGAFGSVYLGSWGITKAAIKLYNLVSGRAMVMSSEMGCSNCGFSLSSLDLRETLHSRVRCSDSMQ